MGQPASQDTEDPALQRFAVRGAGTAATERVVLNTGPPTPSLAQHVHPAVTLKVCDSSISGRAGSGQSGGTRELGRFRDACVSCNTLQTEREVGSWRTGAADVSVPSGLALLD